MISFFKTFTHIKTYIGIIIFSLITCTGIYVYFVSVPAIILFPPNGNFQYIFYTDSTNGGNSEIIHRNITEKFIEMKYKLHSGFYSPYVGISIGPKSGDFLKITHQNKFIFKVEGEGIKNVSVNIYTENPHPKDTINDNQLCFYEIVELEPGRKHYQFDLNELKVPDWWRDAHSYLPNERIVPDWNKVISVTFGPTSPNIPENENSLKIYSASFIRDNENLVILLIISEILFLLLLSGINYFAAKIRAKEINVSVSYKPLDVENESVRIDSFLNYINNNYHDCDLSLEQVSSQTGISQRRITSSIQQNFNCNFKTYINKIRINESERLLKETKLHIGEIAYKVGFNNQSHFNRVFKSTTGLSPTEFRDNN